jgi:hypothetical protein
MTREEAEELILESNPEALFMDGFDDAILGIAERPNLGPLVAYDEDKIIQILASQMETDADDLDGRSVEEVKMEMAIEYYEYNIKCAWLGEGTPIILRTNTDY